MNDKEFLALCLKREELKTRETMLVTERREIESKICDEIGRITKGTVRREFPGLQCKVEFGIDYKIDEELWQRNAGALDGAPEHVKACFRTKHEVSVRNYSSLETVDPRSWEYLKSMDMISTKPKSPSIDINFTTVVKES